MKALLAAALTAMLMLVGGCADDGDGVRNIGDEEDAGTGTATGSATGTGTGAGSGTGTGTGSGSATATDDRGDHSPTEGDSSTDDSDTGG